MVKKCVECYLISELAEEAREQAIETVRGDEYFLYKIAREDAQDAAAWVLAERGFDLEEGPFYDLHRGDFAVRASWHGYKPQDLGGGLTELERRAREANVDIHIWLIPVGDRRTTIEVEVETPEDREDLRASFEEEAHALAEEALEEARRAVAEAWDTVLSDEYVADFAEANERLFTEKGEACPL